MTGIADSNRATVCTRVVENGGRRQFLTGTASLVAAALTSSLSSPAEAAANPPNIVYIVVDDQGWKDVGFHGSDIKTPNLDKLAAEGARLEQF